MKVKSKVQKLNKPRSSNKRIRSKNKRKDNKRLLKIVQAVQDTIFTLLLCLVLMIDFVFNTVIFKTIIMNIFKFIKKYCKQLLMFVCICLLIGSIVISYIKINGLQEEYAAYKYETQNVISELTNTIDTYKSELDTYKEESDAKAKETNTKIENLNKKVTSRSSSNLNRATQQVTGTKAEYQSYAKDLCLNTYDWTESDFECLVKLWDRESNWNPTAKNKSSGAYGIPQSLPANKMASEGDDYLTNYKTQIRWGLNYISNRYGTPTKAWQHSQNKGWY